MKTRLAEGITVRSAILGAAVFAVFAGGAEAQGPERIGPWWVTVQADAMTDEVMAGAVLLSDTAGRPAESAQLMLVCDSGGYSVYFQSPEVLDTQRSVTYRLDTHPARSDGLAHGSNMLSAVDPSAMVLELLETERVLLRVSLFPSGIRDYTWQLRNTQQVVDRLVDVCGPPDDSEP